MSEHKNYEIIHRPNDLKRKTSAPGGKSIAEMSAQANAALDSLAPDFVGRAANDIQEMFELHRCVDDEPARAEAVTDRIIRRAQGIADQARTFGHPVMGEIAALMYDILQNEADEGRHLGTCDPKLRELLFEQLNAMSLTIRANIGREAAQQLLGEMRRAVASHASPPAQ